MSARRFALAVVASLCTIGGGLALGSPAMALNIHRFSGSFGEEGSGDGQLKEPFAVAVNDTTHDVYVSDKGNRRVEEFTSAGAYVGQFAPPGGFLADGPRTIAVDNSGSPLDPSAGDVYVVDGNFVEQKYVVDKFSQTGAYEGRLTAGEGAVPFGETFGVAVDPSGIVWIDTSRGAIGKMESFSDSQVNAFRSNIPIDRCGPGEGLAADSEEHLYYSCREGAALKMAATLKSNQGKDTELDPTEQANGVAVDALNNEVYISASTHPLGLSEQVAAYDSRGFFRERFGSGDIAGGNGLAVDSSNHAVYMTDTTANRIDVFGQLTLPDVSTGEEPTNIANEGAVTLDGTVNPNGLPVTSCEFEYGTDTSYGNVAPCEPAPGSGSGAVTVHANITGLTPLTRYHYRLIAGNANGSNPGIDRSFVAPVQATLEEESVFDVAATSATLTAQVDPGGADTTYRFEYGPSSSYGASVSGDAGAGISAIGVSVHPQDLQQGTTYHYRVVIESPLGTVTGEDGTFSTQPIAGTLPAPDGRVWELVSPADKLGAALDRLGGVEGNVIQAAADGDAITYGMTNPTEEDPPGDRSPENVQVSSNRTLGGWATKVIAVPNATTHVKVSLGSQTEYTLFSSDLSLSVVEAPGEAPLSQETSEKTPYLRHDGTCETDATHCYEPLVDAANAPGAKFGINSPTSEGQVEFVSATADFAHIVLRSGVPLAPGAESGRNGLYEWTDGQLEYVGQMTLGSPGGLVRHAISEDGSRVIGVGSFKGIEGLLMRDMSTQKTTKLDIAEPGAPGGVSEPVFQAASSDGSRVFFTDPARLTVDSAASAGEPDLYEFDVSTGKLSDLSATLNPGEAANVRGQVFGASEDGSYVYFVANGVLAPGASPGNCGPGLQLTPRAKCNLYVSHDGTPSFIASVFNEDGWNSGQRQTGEEMRVSPNGRWLAFMSAASLTGYDNRDAVSGEPDEEVFMYDASANRLVCASCDPTGSRPTGVAAAGEESKETLVIGGQSWHGGWLAALVPGFTNYGEDVEGADTAIYQSRYLSNSGRLFFDSHEALVPQDSNGTWDVYEYEPSEAGDCKSGTITFSQASDGCVGLISSGSSAEESAFVDASEDGSDVFFMTAAGLVPQDFDGAIDMYDAHACSAESPCVPAGAVPPPPCSTGDSCKAAPSPQPQIFGSPPSETFSGAGDIRSSSAKPAVKAKTVTPKQRLASALKACKRKQQKHSRSLCERRARARYAKKAVSKPTVRKRAKTGR